MNRRLLAVLLAVLSVSTFCLAQPSTGEDVMPASTNPPGKADVNSEGRVRARRVAPDALAHLEVFACVGGFSCAPNTRAPEQLFPDPKKAGDMLKVRWISCDNKNGLITNSLRLHLYARKGTFITSGTWMTMPRISITGKPVSAGSHNSFSSSHTETEIAYRVPASGQRKPVHVLLNTFLRIKGEES